MRQMFTRLGLLAGVLAVGLIGGRASADTYNWKQFTLTGTLQWNDANNWTTDIPSISDPAAIINFDPAQSGTTTTGGRINQNFTLNNDLTGLQLNQLNLAGQSSGTNSPRTIVFSGNALTFTNAGAAINNNTTTNGGNGRINFSIGNTLNIFSTDLTINHSAVGTPTMTFTGGTSGSGSLIINSNITTGISFTTAAINHAGTITNSGIGTGTTTISGGIGPNVTGITLNSITSALTISTTALTVNSGGTTLTNSSGTKLLTVSGGVGGTGNLILDNDSATDGGITISTTAVGNGGTITNSGSGTGSSIISSVINTGVTGGVVQDSATSQLTLSGNNTFTTGLTIKRGTVSGTSQVTAFGAAAGTINLGFTGVADGATLLGDTRTFAQNIVLASGHLGTLTIGNSGSTTTVFSSNISMVHDLTLAGSGTGSVRLAGLLTGSSALRLNSATDATAALSGANTGYNGTITLDAGTLSVQNANALGTGTLVINGGLLSANAALVNGGNNVININGSFTFSSSAANSYDLGTGAVTVAAAPVTITTTAAHLTLGGTLTGGAGGLIKDGAGMLSLGGTNNLAGNMTVNGGALRLTKVVALNNNDFTVASGATLGISVGGVGEFNDTNIDTLKVNAGFAAGSMLGLDTTSGNYTYGGTIGGDIGLNKLGTNTLVLTNTHTYTGPTTVTGGTLQIGDGTTNGSISTSSAINNLARLQFSRNGTFAIDPNISGAGGIVLNSGGTYSFTGTNTFTGAVSINGNATLNVTSELPSTTIVLGGIDAIPTGTIRLAPGNFDLNGNSYTATGFHVASNNATANVITIDSGDQLTVNGLFRIGYSDSSGGTVKATFTGGGALEINNSVGAADFTYYGNTSANNPNGTIDLSGLSSMAVTAATFNFGGSTQGSTSTLTLAAGTNTINASNLYIASGNNINNKGAGTIGFAGSVGSLIIRGVDGGDSRATVMRVAQGPGTGGTLNGTLNLLGHNVSILTTTLQLGTAGASGTTGTGTGTINFDTGTIDTTTLTMGSKSGSGSGKSSGVLNMDGGSLIVGTGGVTLGSQTGSGSASGTMNLTGGEMSTLGAIIDGGGNNVSTLNLAGGSLNMNGNAIGDATNAIDSLILASGTLSNVAQINNGGAITKTTDGTLALTGTNTFTGPTNVSAGTLRINGTATTAVTAAANTTLGGSGSTTGAATVSGTLAPGNSVGTLTVGGLTFNAGSKYSVEVDKATVTADSVVVTAGTVSLGAGNATLELVFSDNITQPFAQTFFLVVNNTGGALDASTDYFANRATNISATEYEYSDSSLQFVINYNANYGGAGNDGIANDVSISFTSVPEPASLSLLALGGLGLLKRRRRSK